MELERHRLFTDELRRILEARPEVLGLVALGSMAEIGELPDAYSDHDFFVIARPDAAEGLRDSDDWLPARSRLVLRFRETAHGGKAIYDDGHLVEYAVFTPDEIALARVNRYRVIFDRADVAERMRAVAEETRARIVREAPDDGWLVGQLLSEILVAALREARGEHLSASQRRAAAVRHLLALIARHVPAAPGARADDLDPTRRVESTHSVIAERLYEGERASARAHLEAILAIGETALAPRIAGWPSAAWRAVEGRVAAVLSG